MSSENPVADIAKQSENIQAIGARMGLAQLQRRLDLETNREMKLGGLVRWCPMKYAGPAVRFAFKFSGLWKTAYRQFLDLRLKKETFEIANLPEALDGFRILHLSDLHLDISPDLAPVIRKKLAECAGSYDIAVVTGDFSNYTVHEDKVALREAAALRDSFTAPVFGCLGNHDSIRDVESLENSGYRILLNESVRVRRQGASSDAPSLFLAGIDDPNIFKTHDLKSALAGRTAGEPSVLISHAPSIYAEAAAFGVSLVLCGHVHGGQLCWKNGRQMVPRRWKFPKAVRKGRWNSGLTQGFTTTGVGACGAPLRLNCPPEIVLVELSCARRSAPPRAVASGVAPDSRVCEENGPECRARRAVRGGGPLGPVGSAECSPPSPP